MPSAAAKPASNGHGAMLWVYLITVYILWGSTYFGIAIAVKTMPPFLMAAIRFAIAGSLLVAWDVLRHPDARHLPSRRQLIDSAIVGGLLLGVGNAFVTFGEVTVPSGVAAIIIATIPLWFAVLGWVYFRERLPRLVVGAIALGFFGTALLVAPVGTGSNSFEPLGIVILFCAPIGWAHGSLYSAKRAKLPPSPLTASGLQMLAGAALCLLEAALTGEPARFHPEQISFESILGVAYLVIFGSMVAFTAYAWLLKHAPLSLVGTYAYVNPIVAIGLGTLFLGETLSLRTIVASAIIVTAVAIIVTARSRLGSGSTAASDEATSLPTAAASANAPTVPGASAAATVRPAMPPRAVSD